MKTKSQSPRSAGAINFLDTVTFGAAWLWTAMAIFMAPPWKGGLAIARGSAAPFGRLRVEELYQARPFMVRR
jgi:preprotein translocase subunit SecG